MKVLVYSARSYDRSYLDSANREKHDLHFTEVSLDERTAVLARDYPAVCCFVHDKIGADVLKQLRRGGTGLVALRATGFSNVDLENAGRLGMVVMRVGHYSPQAVAEFAVGLLLTMNRKIHRAHQRVRDGNFSLEGLMGFDVHGKTVGVVGTGRIGTAFSKIMNGFGCGLLGHDKHENAECIELGMRYVSLEELLRDSDIISLHCPLTPETHHMINPDTIALLKPNVMLVNTSRGALIDTDALIPYLKKCRTCYVCLDVYEEEADLYYRDLSDEVIEDDVIMRLLTFPNVLITGHQAFFTREAMETIARTTIKNIDDFAAGRTNKNIVKPEDVTG